MKQYRQALAETPVCILDDDPDSDSITVAIRLPRKIIADNHLLLASLSEAASGDKRLPALDLGSGRTVGRLASIASLAAVALALAASLALAH